jgi:transposase
MQFRPPRPGRRRPARQRIFSLFAKLSLFSGNRRKERKRPRPARRDRRTGPHPCRTSPPHPLHFRIECLLFLPPYSPELNPAEHLWPLTNAALDNQHFATIEELEDAQLARCTALQQQPDLIHAIRQGDPFPLVAQTDPQTTRTQAELIGVAPQFPHRRRHTACQASSACGRAGRYGQDRSTAGRHRQARTCVCPASSRAHQGATSPDAGSPCDQSLQNAQ